MKSSSHTFLQVSGGVAFFARVGVEPSASPAGQEVSVAPAALEHPDWAAAAERGVRYALAHSLPPQTSGIRLLVTSIRGTGIDTTPDAVAAAACFATWEALGVVGTHPPRLEGREFVFEL